MAVHSRPTHSILRTPSQTHCSFSGSCHGSLSSRRVTFATDLTSPTQSRRRPSPPSTVPPPIHVTATPVAKHHPHPTPQVVVEKHKHRHHHHHGRHHRCKKHALAHAHERAVEYHPHHQHRGEPAHQSAQWSKVVDRRRRVRNAGVKKKRVRGEALQKGKRRKASVADPKKNKNNAGARSSKARDNAGQKRDKEGAAQKKDKERTSHQRSERKPLKESPSRDTETQVLAATVGGDSSGRRSRRESKEGGRDHHDEEKGERRREGRDAEKRGESREEAKNDKRRESRGDDDKRKPKRSSTEVNELKRTRRAVAKRLQLGRDDLSYTVLEPVDACVLYELYKKVKGHSDEDDGGLKSRLVAQENKEGRTRASRKRKDALAKWVAGELKSDVEQMRQLSRRELVDRYVIAAVTSRMARLRERKCAGGYC